MYCYQALQNAKGPYSIFCQIYLLNGKDVYLEYNNLEAPYLTTSHTTSMTFSMTF